MEVFRNIPVIETLVGIEGSFLLYGPKVFFFNCFKVGSISLLKCDWLELISPKESLLSIIKKTNFGILCRITENVTFAKIFNFSPHAYPLHAVIPKKGDEFGMMKGKLIS